MIEPRNTLVVLEIIEQSERKIGSITVPTNNECYAEADVVAVGPGTIEIDGQRPATFDLKPGQRVYVKHKRKLQGGGGLTKLEDEGLPYTDKNDSTRKLILVEQGSIIGILAQPGELPTAKPTSKIVLN